MRVGLHNEPCGGALGGSEFCVAVLAERLAANHSVEILHHRHGLTADCLQSHCGVDLHNVLLREVPDLQARCDEGRNFWTRYLHQRRAEESTTADYDLFITFTHGFPPFCGARVGMLVVLFPFASWTDIYGDEGEARPSLRSSLRRLWQGRNWQARMNTYQVKASISNFTQRWTRQRWQTQSDILFPPVDNDFASATKSDAILSVGRFAVEGHAKKQAEMIQAYEDLVRSGAPKWTYSSVGACGPSEKETMYFEEISKRGREAGVSVRANLGRGQLKRLFSEAKLFWHAAGLDSDEMARPELAEHFGIATVEAMAAGCVPLVINRGAQPELVEHGVSGYVWETVNELRNYTARLMEDTKLLAKMSSAAAARASSFGREPYLRRVETMLAPFIVL